MLFKSILSVYTHLQLELFKNIHSKLIFFFFHGFMKNIITSYKNVFFYLDVLENCAKNILRLIFIQS